MKSLFTAAVLALTAMPALANPTGEEMQLPPMTYAQLTFEHPNGCVYTRADPEGHGRRWIVISNGNAVVAGARDGDQCTATLVQPMG